MQNDVGLVVVWVLFVLGWMAATIYLLVEILRVAKRIDVSVTRLAYGEQAPAELERRDAIEKRKDPAAGIRAQEEAARRERERR